MWVSHIKNGCHNDGQAAALAMSAAFRNLRQEFKNDSRGSIVLIFALMFTLVVTIVGGSVDYARWLAARGQTVSAMDAAVLAAGRVIQLGKSDTEAVAAAQQYYNRNKARGLSIESVSFTIEKNRSEILAVSNSRVHTPILGIAGIPDLPIVAKSRSVVSVGANAGSNVEISLMLDTTGSMDWNSSAGGKKITHLKAAAKDLIDIVVWDDQSAYTSKVALAPFAKYVNVGEFAEKVTDSSSRKCVKERSGSSRYTDDKPNSANGFFSSSSSWSCGEAIVPLTNNKTALKAAIDDLPASGSTAGHIGTAWAWYLLSPNWNSVWPLASNAMPYSMMAERNRYGQPKLRKIAVLMTDGEFNTWYSGSSSTVQARAVCENMKTAGIEIYAVGFEIAAGGEADTTLSQCASSTDHYYNATDGEQLRSAFRDIALKISTLRIKE